ncbi:MAG: trypsin-like peptidase domain-containing protein [Candidatus Thiodiazotropha sp. (ex Ctena orbiculata)]|uniref:Trypsin-like peptidase domain-containing protein n=1 Tax=Candidatus Thiodiazotropha taylori TaxID=2792791 RepID=A0A944M9V4_9GAMM|nr:trypsin-like peptidase domain-containing protein [Candidatus Thiodiazotropha taylori]
MKNILSVSATAFIALMAFGAYDLRAEDTNSQTAQEAFKAGDYVKAYQIVSQEAESGDPNAQLGRCILLWHGLGTPENTKEAINWCKKASDEKTNAENYASLFEKISNKVGATSSNKSKALKRLEELAVGGDDEAQWLMYQAHDKKLFDIKERDEKSKSLWFGRALASEYPGAIIEEARKYIFDRDNPESLQKYISLMEKAADKGDAYAMSMLGSTYQPIGYIDRSKEDPHKDYEKATYWYRKAAEADPDYAWELATILRESRNPERDYDEALNIILTLKDKKWATESHVELAKLLLDGDELPRDKQAASALLKNALNRKYVDFDAVFVPASYMLGKIEESKAHEYYKAIFSHQFAKYIRPGMYESSDEISASAYKLAQHLIGENAQKNSEEIHKLLKIASDLGDSRATRLLDLEVSNNTKNPAILVRNIQVNLKKLGFNVGPIDGVFGQKTFDSLRAFQCLNNLPLSGIPNEGALQALKEAKKGSITREALREKLFKGISNLEVDCVRGALDLGVDPNARKYRGPIGSVYKYADRRPSEDEGLDLRYQITKMLIAYGSKVSPVNSNIFSAISDGDSRLLRLLLKNGENAFRKIDGLTLMQWAAHYGQEESMAVLAEFGVPALSTRQKEQHRIANIPPSIRSGSGIRIVEAAVKNGAWINGKDGRGLTPLGSAVDNGIYEKNHADLIEYLLENGADPNTKYGVRFRYGENDPIVKESLPLNHFVMSNAYTMNEQGGRSKSKANIHTKEYAVRAMKALIDKGAKVAGRDSVGRTPLHWAAKVGNLEAAKILLNSGAIGNHRDNLRATPLDYAESAEMIALLKGVGKSLGENGGKKQVKPSSGSGFIVNNSGHVVTNSHVVDECKTISVRGGNSSDVAAKIVSLDKKNDIALLIVDGLKEQLSPIRATDVRLGEAVMAAGYPYGEFVSSDLKVTSGIVSGVKGLGDDSAQFQLDAAIQPGNSGGPIFDRQGNIVGIVVSQLNKLKMAIASGSLPENTNFAIKAGTVRAFLEANGVTSENTDLSGYLSTEAIAQIAAKQTLMVRCNN